MTEPVVQTKLKVKDATGVEVEVPVTIVTPKERSRLFRSRHAGATGPVQMKIHAAVDASTGRVLYRAEIRVDSRLHLKDVDIALAHELDELAQAVHKGWHGAHLEAQLEAGLMKPGTATAAPAPTLHDVAIANELTRFHVKMDRLPNTELPRLHAELDATLRAWGLTDSALLQPRWDSRGTKCLPGDLMDAREWFAQRLKLRLNDSPAGPYPQGMEEALEPLSGAVRAAAERDPGREELERYIREGTPWYDRGLSVEPVEGDMCRITVPWLNNENIVPRALLLEAIVVLRELRARERVPAPWLFRPDPVWPNAVDPKERELVSAIDFDDVDALEAYGLLSAEHRDNKRMLLAEWALPVDVYDAALEAQAYLDSPERREQMPQAEPVALKDAPVSLDLFRAGLFPPPGVSRFAWAAIGEHLLEDDEDEDADAAAEGSVMLHDAGGWLIVLWKRAPAGHRQVRAIAQRATPDVTETGAWFAQRLEVRRTQSLWGPSPDPIDDELEPLANAVHGAAAGTGGREELERHIREQKPWHDDGLMVEPIEGDRCRITVPWRASENVVSRALLLRAIAALRAVGEGERVPAPWLFRPDPVWPTATDRKERHLVTAAAIDDLDVLEACGLLSAEHRDNKRRLLESWGLRWCIDAYDAALEAQAYLDSPERREEMPWAEPVSLKEAPVSLDLFRAGLFPPPGVSRFAWAAVGEHLLEDDEDVDAAAEGSVMLHDAGGWLVVLWKRAPAGHRRVHAISLRATPA